MEFAVLRSGQACEVYIESLISDNSRFALENLLQHMPQIWLSRRNQVIVKFIETLTHNNLNTDSPNNEKLYKRAMAVDLIYGSRHGNGELLEEVSIQK